MQNKKKMAIRLKWSAVRGSLIVISVAALALFAKGTPVRAACNNAYGTVHYSVDMIRVPDYVFAAAEYWTPIKFKILPETTAGLIQASWFTSIKATLHYHDASGGAQTKEISGLEAYVEATAANAHIFECYIAPSHYDTIDIANKHHDSAAYFTLAVEFANPATTWHTVKCESSASDNEAKIAKRFVDKAIYAVDMTDANTAKTVTRTADPRPFAASVPKRRWEGVTFPLLWGVNQGPVNVGGLIYSLWIFESYDTSGTFGSSPALPYWDHPKVPKWQHRQKTGILPIVAINDTCFDTASMPANNNFSGSISVGGTPTPAVCSEVEMIQKGDNTDRGTYVGKNFGLRSGAYYFISYGGKDPPCVTLPSGQRAMDLDKTQAKGILKVYNGQAQASLDTPGAITSTMAQNTLNFAWKLLSAVTPVSKILGLGVDIFNLVTPANTVGNYKGYSQVQAWQVFSTETDTTEVQWAPGSTDMEHLQTVIPSANDGTPQSTPMVVKADYPDSNPQTVGTMIAAFVELTTTAQLIARDTAGIGFVDKSVATAYFGTSATDKDDIEIRCVHEP